MSPIARPRLATVALLGATLAGSVFATDAVPAKTRAQVQAEWADAVRQGDFVVNDATGATARERCRGCYPALAGAAGKTRDQVRADWAAAQAAGDLLANPETGQTAYEREPGRFPRRTAAIVMTCEQVAAERDAALRPGTLPIYRP